MVTGETLIVQFRLAADFGGEDEIRLREDFTLAVHDGLQARGLGRFDGRDTGGGAFNLFFVDVSSTRLAEAIQVVTAQIDRFDLHHRIIVAKSVVIPKEPDPEVEHVVVWPPNSAVIFDIFRWSGPPE